MLSVVKTVVLSAGNAEEIAIESKHISSLMHFIAGIYIIIICPLWRREVIAGKIIIIIICPAPRGLNSTIFQHDVIIQKTKEKY